MQTENNSKVEIKVLIPDAIITEHSELLEVYSQERESITYDIDNNIPKEFIENLEQLVPQFHGNDIVLFTPLIEKINQLQAIKQVAYNPDDFDASDRLFIDNNKLIGNFNSTIKEAKSLLKQPQISKNKLIDKIFELFENEAKNTRGALEEEFKPLITKREELKQAAENKKKAAELEKIANLSNTNTELSEKLAKSEKATATMTIENSINSILTNVAVKIPALNKEGLQSLKEAVQKIEFINYAPEEITKHFTEPELSTYLSTFNSNKQAAVRNIDLALQGLEHQSANMALTSENAVLQAQVPNVSEMEVGSFEQLGPQPPENFGGLDESGAIQVNDAILFQQITDRQKYFAEEYKKMIEQTKLIKFANPQVAELRDKLTNEQFPKVLEWLEKLSTFCNTKQELVNQHFNK